jgi:ubiquinone/menaquinone biosynthesis C-methylase UbiE
MRKPWAQPMACLLFPAMHSLSARLLPWLFERLYHELASCYDLVAALVSGGYWFDWIRAAVPALEGASVLELGCGTGHLQLALARAGLPRAGVDLSRPMLHQARRRLRSASYELCLLHATARRLPFVTGSFSDVVATFPAPYILDPTTLTEVRRVLRPEGQLVIVDGGVLHERGWLEAALALLYGPATPGESGGRYRARLAEAGFEVEVLEPNVGDSTIMVIRARPIGDADA